MQTIELAKEDVAIANSDDRQTRWPNPKGQDSRLKKGKSQSSGQNPRKGTARKGTARKGTEREKSARQLAFEALRAIDRGAFADVVIDRKLNGSKLSAQDKGLVTELVYGSVRRQRTLDALIDQFGTRKASQQQADLLQILRLGFYQLRYLTHVPDHAVVDTTVQLAKAQRLGKLSGVVNGMLRGYIRQS
ncbi:MAG: transcription antitermination factor NusB [Phormidesmis sp.]